MKIHNLSRPFTYYKTERFKDKFWALGKPQDNGRLFNPMKLRENSISSLLFLYFSHKLIQNVIKRKWAALKIVVFYFQFWFKRLLCSRINVWVLKQVGCYKSIHPLKWYNLYNTCISHHNGILVFFYRKIQIYYKYSEWKDYIYFNLLILALKYTRFDSVSSFFLC